MDTPAGVYLSLALKDSMDTTTILDNVTQVSARFAGDRWERQRRRELSADDFKALREAGFLLSGVPVAQGGVWEDVHRSTRSICEMLRALAHGDPSVALVSSMHPAVLSFWLTTSEAPAPYQEVWKEQCRRVFDTAREGHWWGTITSEPGSGGDLARTRATAARDPSQSRYLLSGQKHFGSGSGITSFMITTALPEGEDEPDWFFMDMRGIPWDGSAGVKLLAPWDGHGMAATQSHGMSFEKFPAERMAWPGNYQTIAGASFGFIACAFAAVILGVLETAIESARNDLKSRREGLRAYERVEWARADMEGWLARQAYEGMLKEMERGQGTPHAVLHGKVAIAELAESATRRICRIVGGGTFTRYSPYGYWFEDVRALGFLRPPWGIAFDRIYDGSWPEE